MFDLQSPLNIIWPVLMLDVLKTLECGDEFFLVYQCKSVIFLVNFSVFLHIHELQPTYKTHVKCLSCS